jgi:hypothetical protein
MNNFTRESPGRLGCDLWESPASAAPGTQDGGFALFFYGVLLYNDNGIEEWRSGICNLMTLVF